MSSNLSSPVKVSRQLHTPFLERASEDSSGTASQLALGAFLTLRAVDAASHPEVDAEAFTYQLDALDQFIAELADSEPETDWLAPVAASLRGTLDGAWNDVWTVLLDYEEWLEGEFRIEEALDVVGTAIASASLHDEQILSTLELRRARALRRRGDFGEASQTYRRAGELALLSGNGHVERISRIGLALVSQNKGNLPAAQSILEQVVQEAVAAGDTDAEARANHDLAVNYLRRSDPATAVPLAHRAYQLYDTDAMRYRAIGDLGMALYQLGHLAAARDAQELVAAGPVSPGMKISALLELLDTTAAMQDRMAFERIRREIAKREDTLPPDWTADFYLKLGTGFRDFGQSELARTYLEKAVAFAERHDLHQYTLDAEKALDELTPPRDVPSSDALAPSSTPDFGPEVAEIAEELHHLRVH